MYVSLAPPGNRVAMDQIVAFENSKAEGTRGSGIRGLCFKVWYNEGGGGQGGPYGGHIFGIYTCLEHCLSLV